MHNSFISLLVVASLTGCGSEEKKKDEQPELANVECTKVSRQTLSRVDQLPGEIRAYQDVQVYPKVPGFIDWIGIDRGSKVKKGELMVRLVAPELKAQSGESLSKVEEANGRLSEGESKLGTAKATLLEAKAVLAGDDDTYKRTKDASKVPGVVAPNDVVVLEQKVNADKEKVRACEETIKAVEHMVTAEKQSLNAAKKASENYQDIEDYLKIYAPFDGFVTERNMHVGSFVGPRGQGAYPPIVSVQQLSLLRIITPVPEIDVSGVTDGAKVEFSVSTHPGERFVGTVARLGNYLDQKTRTMPVELSYPNPGWRILPGMFCEVYWPTTRKNQSLFVPETAVDSNSTLEAFVMRIGANNKIEWVKVKRGQTMKGMCEVFGELKEGDRVAIKSDDSLKPETEVKPVMREETKSM